MGYAVNEPIWPVVQKFQVLQGPNKVISSSGLGLGLGVGVRSCVGLDAGVHWDWGFYSKTFIFKERVVNMSQVLPTPSIGVASFSSRPGSGAALHH